MKANYSVNYKCLVNNPKLTSRLLRHHQSKIRIKTLCQCSIIEDTMLTLDTADFQSPIKTRTL